MSSRVKDSSGPVYVATPPYHTGTNPYISLLRENLAECGVEVVELNRKSLRKFKVSVVHVHWPELRLRNLHRKKNKRYFKEFLKTILVAKIKRIPIVWTVHNSWPHEELPSRFLLGLYYRVWTRVVSGCVYMSERNKETNERRHKSVNGKPYCIIAHPHYRDVLPEPLPVLSVKKLLGFDEESLIICHIGKLRPYKNTVKLLQEFATLKDHRLRLVIGGACSSDELRSCIQGLADQDSRVLFIDRFLSDQEASDIISASVLSALPYSAVDNSGAALMSLSLNTPVLCPNMGSLAELGTDLGNEWVYLYENELAAEHLEAALALFRKFPQNRVVDLSKYGWNSYAKKLKEFYLELTTR